MKILRHVVSIGLCLLTQASLAAENFPSRPFQIIMPFTPGSAAENNVRYVGERLTEELGQPVVIVHKPGASGAIGINALHAEPADGHTLYYASNSPLTVNPHVVKEFPFKEALSMKPISGFTRAFNVLVVAKNSSYNTVQDLVEASKAKPGGLSGGTFTQGYRLAVEWLATLSGLKFTNIGYAGGSQPIVDLVGGRLDFAMVNVDGASAMIKSGQVKAIAISADKRHELFPDIPTLVESGFPDFINYSWDAFYVHGDTPDDIRGKLSRVLKEILARKDVAEYVRQSSRELMPLEPDDMEGFQVAEYERFGRIAKVAGIVPQ